MNKYLLSVYVVSGVSLLLVGCAGVPTETASTQGVSRVSIDKKMQELEQKVATLNKSSQNLENRVEDIARKTVDTEENYSKIQRTLDGVSSRMELKDNAFETVLAETQRNISALEKKMVEVEKIKTDLQNQLLGLQVQKSRIGGSKIDQQAGAMKEEAKEMIKQGREMVKEATGEKKSEEDKKIEAIAATHEAEALQKLLDEALTLYRDGQYQEAIGKWEEALVIDPSNLEAKFNIEITKEKTKSLPDK